jgi:hypothetical protein
MTIDPWRLEIGSTPPDWFFRGMDNGEIVPVPRDVMDGWGHKGAKVMTRDGVVHANIGDWVERADDGSLSVRRAPADRWGEILNVNALNSIFNAPES